LAQDGQAEDRGASGAEGRLDRLSRIPEVLASLELITKNVRELTMEWTTPQFEEISLTCEINSEASAKM
jgi:hypothetical protein